MLAFIQLVYFLILVDVESQEIKGAYDNLATKRAFILITAVILRSLGCRKIICIFQFSVE